MEQMVSEVEVVRANPMVGCMITQETVEVQPALMMTLRQMVPGAMQQFPKVLPITLQGKAVISAQRIHRQVFLMRC